MESNEIKTTTAQHPDEMVVQLAHLAGVMENRGQIEAAEWNDLTKTIYEVIGLYLNDSSESKNPFALEEAAEHYFIAKYGKEEFREAADANGWSNLSLSELISASKASIRIVSDIPRESEPVKNENHVTEDDKVIFVSKENGELWFFDSYSKENFEEEFANLDPRLLRPVG